MFSPPVPAWKKWLMLAMIVSFVIMAAIFFHQRRSAREWDPNRPLKVLKEGR
jgi:uncharacterized membrane protein affecting hemolysin expression